jgi:hypothetical protein
MSEQAEFVLVASMDVETERERLFNEVYDTEHVPNLARVPGVLSIARYERIELSMSIAGEVRQMPSTQPRYHAVYALSSPDVLVSEGWAAGVERGRWPGEVRPFTRNRQHLLLRRLPGGVDGNPAQRFGR